MMLTVLLIVLMCVGGYGLIAVHVGVRTYVIAKRRGGYYSDADVFGSLAGAFWPIGVWFLLAMHVIEGLDKAAADERQGVRL